MASQPSLVALAKQISELSTQVHDLLEASGRQQPSFEASSLDVPETAEYEALRGPLNDAALDLLRLVNGPKNTLRSFYFTHYDLAALQVALDWNFFDLVPLAPVEYGLSNGLSNGHSNGHAVKPVEGIEVAELAQKAGMDEDRAGRVLRMLATQRIFEEVPGHRGRFRHTANSALLAANDDWKAMAAMQMDELFRAASETSAEIARSPLAATPENTALHARFGKSLYEYYQGKPDMSKRFTKAMGAWSKMDRQIAGLRDGFEWDSIKDGKVVDIGGGSGYASIAIARRFPQPKFVVQDLFEHMLKQTQSTIKDLDGRISFQQHDFFTPQPIVDADVFLLRQCLHNYNDADCVRILRAIIPALEQNPKTVLLINDIILPESGTLSLFEEQYLRQIDITMLVVLNAKERTEREFRALLEAADPRFTVQKVSTNAFGVGLVQVGFRGN